MDRLDPHLKIEFLDEVAAKARAKRLDKLVSYQGEVFSKSRDYANFIIVAGYAAFFALWTGMADDLEASARLVSGALMGVSLILFIAWELFSIGGRMRAGARIGATLREAEDGYPDDFEERWDRAVAANHRLDLLTMRVWPWVFVPSALAGLAGASILGLSAFLAVLKA